MYIVHLSVFVLCIYKMLLLHTSKRMQQFVKFVCCFLIRNRATLLWFVREAPENGIAALFAKRAAIWQKVPQSLDCGTLQDGTLQRGHQSAALLVAEKRRRKVAHMPPCFPSAAMAHLCILFDVYRNSSLFGDLVLVFWTKEDSVSGLSVAKCVRGSAALGS